MDEEALNKFEADGKVIEKRSYNTVHGVWHYFTLDDKQVELDKYDYLMIGTVQSYVDIRDYYGSDKVVPIYIELDDGVRLQRALNREISQSKPKYEEMCRRYLADAADFSEEKLKEAGITRSFSNDDLNLCIADITEFINGYQD